MLILRYTVLIFVLSGCVLVQHRLPKDGAAGRQSFTVRGTSEEIYEKMLGHARSCYEQAPTTDPYVVIGAPPAGEKYATISILREHAFSQITLFFIEITEAEAGAAAVSIYYSQERYKKAAATMEEWITRDSSDCNRDQVDVQCICKNSGNQKNPNRNSMFSGEPGTTAVPHDRSVAGGRDWERELFPV